MRQLIYMCSCYGMPGLTELDLLFKKVWDYRLLIPKQYFVIQLLISKRNFLLGVICLAHTFSNAQSKKAAPEDYRMVNWNFEQGFPHKKTTAILKDIKGFLWIGTETGLSRFDGSVFKNDFPATNSSQNVPTGIILGLTEDSLHNIWIGSDKGLWRYDNLADSFSHFLPYDTVAYSNTYIIPFWSTKDELLCVE